jgi:hypothetical protein
MPAHRRQSTFSPKEEPREKRLGNECRGRHGDREGQGRDRDQLHEGEERNAMAQVETITHPVTRHGDHSAAPIAPG